MTNLDWKVKESVRVIKEAYKRWYPFIGIAFTGKKDSTVLTHLIKTYVPLTPQAMFIDHGYHFEETITNVKQLSKLWNLDLIIMKDEEPYLGEDRKKIREYIDNYKIKSIKNCVFQNSWKALFTAIRWDEQPARKKETYFSERKTHYRVHPLLHFSEEDIWQYIRINNLKNNPLYDMGFRSIGEKGFTKITKLDFQNERAGRDQDKEEVMERLRSLGYF